MFFSFIWTFVLCYLVTKSQQQSERVDITPQQNIANQLVQTLDKNGDGYILQREFCQSGDLNIQRSLYGQFSNCPEVYQFLMEEGQTYSGEKLAGLTHEILTQILIAMDSEIEESKKDCNTLRIIVNQGSQKQGIIIKPLQSLINSCDAFGITNKCVYKAIQGKKKDPFQSMTRCYTDEDIQKVSKEPETEAVTETTPNEAEDEDEAVLPEVKKLVDNAVRKVNEAINTGEKKVDSVVARSQEIMNGKQPKPEAEKEMINAVEENDESTDGDESVRGDDSSDEDESIGGYESSDGSESIGGYESNDGDESTDGSEMSVGDNEELLSQDGGDEEYVEEQLPRENYQELNYLNDQEIPHKNKQKLAQDGEEEESVGEQFGEEALPHENDQKLTHPSSTQHYQVEAPQEETDLMQDEEEVEPRRLVKRGPPISPIVRIKADTDSLSKPKKEEEVVEQSSGKLSKTFKGVVSTAVVLAAVWGANRIHSFVSLKGYRKKSTYVDFNPKKNNQGAISPPCSEDVFYISPVKTWIGQKPICAFGGEPISKRTCRFPMALGNVIQGALNFGQKCQPMCKASYRIAEQVPLKGHGIWKEYLKSGYILCDPDKNAAIKLRYATNSINAFSGQNSYGEFLGAGQTPPMKNDMPMHVNNAPEQIKKTGGKKTGADEDTPDDPTFEETYLGKKVKEVAGKVWGGVQSGSNKVSSSTQYAVNRLKSLWSSKKTEPKS